MLTLKQQQSHLQADKVFTLSVYASAISLQFPKQHSQADCHCPSAVGLVNFSSFSQCSLDNVAIIVIVLKCDKYQHK